MEYPFFKYKKYKINLFCSIIFNILLLLYYYTRRIIFLYYLFIVFYYYYLYIYLLIFFFVVSFIIEIDREGEKSLRLIYDLYIYLNKLREEGKRKRKGNFGQIEDRETTDKR